MPFPTIPVFVMPPDFALADFMCHTCDLYRPADLSRAVSGLPGVADFTRTPTPAYTGVLCHFQSTMEFDESKPQGLSKQTNVLTSDRWHFLQAQEIEDTWLIVMRTVDHPDYGKAWAVQGNGTSNADQPGRPAGSQWFLAKLTAMAEIPS